jgi:YggT family protein
MYAVYKALNWVLLVFEGALFVRVFISWLPIPRENKFIELLYAITEPVLGPIRNLLNRSSFLANSMFDFSPIAAFLLVDIIRNMISNIFRMF